MRPLKHEPLRKHAKQLRGETAYRAGLAAEDSVAQHYARGGYPILATRWRGSRGEIDLIARNGEGVIFIEVKKSKSHGQAAARLSRMQMDRLYGAGSEFLAGQPNGQLTEVRFDVALVDGQGRIKVIENAFMGG